MLKLSKISNLPFVFIFIILGCNSTFSNKKDKNKYSTIIQSKSAKSIYINCDPKQYESIFKNFKENIYINVTISYNGKKWQNVKMRIRGDSSRKLPKKSLKLKFSKKEPFINDKTKINLNAEWYDKSYMNQYLSSYLMRREGVYCFESQHVLLYLNNKFHGIFLMIENIDEKFLSSRNINPNQTLYKSTKDGATFNDTSEVFHLWEKKTNKKDLSRDDLKKIIFEVNQLNIKNAYEYFKTKFDYDRLLTAIAINILTSNKSTYYHNYYLLHNHKNEKWNYIPWDMDKTLMKELIDLHYSKSTWSEGYNSNLADNPIPELIFLNKKMRNDLKNKIIAIVENSFNPANMNIVIDSMSAILTPFIGLDNNDNIRSIEVWENAILDLKGFIEERPKVIKSQMINYPKPFLVFPSKNSIISWSKSSSPSKVLYTLFMCEDYDFKKSKVYSFETQDTIINVSGLNSGKYYFYVNAENSNGITTGFRIKQKILIK